MGHVCIKKCVRVCRYGWSAEGTCVVRWMGHIAIKQGVCKNRSRDIGYTGGGRAGRFLDGAEPRGREAQIYRSGDL